MLIDSPPIQLVYGYWILGPNAAVTPAREEMNSFDISCCRSANLKQEVMERQKACQSLRVHGSSVHETSSRVFPPDYKFNKEWLLINEE